MTKAKKRAEREEAALKLQDIEGLAAELQSESDRAVALLGAALLDERLRHLLAVFFVEDDHETQRLLEPDCPLGTFSARSRIAYCLGLIDNETFRALGSIRTVRNAFAHQLHGLSFSTPNIKSECTKLRAELGMPSDYPATPRQEYVYAVMSIGHVTLASAAQRIVATGSRRQVPAWRRPILWASTGEYLIATDETNALLTRGKPEGEQEPTKPTIARRRTRSDKRDTRKGGVARQGKQTG